MTKEEAILKLKEAANLGEEEGHIVADDVLCELLVSLGYGDVVDAYESIHKWYT